MVQSPSSKGKELFVLISLAGFTFIIYECHSSYLWRTNLQLRVPARLNSHTNTGLGHRPYSSVELDLQLKHLMVASYVEKQEQLELKLRKNHTRYAKKMCDITYKCNNTQRWGHHDHELERRIICVDEPYEPQKNNCLIYWFGMEEKSTFDLENEDYGCEANIFNPSTKMNNYGHNIHWHDFGLSDEKKLATLEKRNIRMMRFRDCVRMLQHQKRTIDIVHIDIGGLEWDVLHQMLSDDSFDLVKQLQVTAYNLKTPYLQYLTLEVLDTYGLGLFHFRKVDCEGKMKPCTELSYVNTNFERKVD